MKNATLHAFNRLAFGPRPKDLELEGRELEAYIEGQLYPSEIADRAVEEELSALDALTLSGLELIRKYPDRREQRIGLEQLTRAKLTRALASERQLNEVMVDFWYNHFNVFAGKGACRVLVPSYERVAIRPYVFGKFRELVFATAKHPAMLFYLDNWLSVSGRVPARGRRRGLNENYARELMELHTLGVDGGYTQQDVVEVARAFTGWTIEGPRRPTFFFAPPLHDNESKLILGREITAGGMREGEHVLEMLCRHPSTARFISTKLVRRFVSDDPPPALVDRVARTFARSDGDIRDMLKTIFGSEEFAASEQRKVKTPFEFLISALRAADARVENPGILARFLGRLGQPLYAAIPPTGYPDTGADWMSPGTLMTRLNFVTQMAVGRLPGVTIPGREAESIIRTLGAPEFQRR